MGVSVLLFSMPRSLKNCENAKSSLVHSRIQIKVQVLLALGGSGRVIDTGSGAYQINEPGSSTVIFWPLTLIRACAVSPGEMTQLK